jgi:hypothetical protein
VLELVLKQLIEFDCIRVHTVSFTSVQCLPSCKSSTVEELQYTRYEPRLSVLAQYYNSCITLVTGQYCPLQSRTLRSLYTMPSASPTAGYISATPVSRCCPVLHVIQVESLKYPQISIPFARFSLCDLL